MAYWVKIKFLKCLIASLLDISLAEMVEFRETYLQYRRDEAFSQF